MFRQAVLFFLLLGFGACNNDDSKSAAETTAAPRTLAAFFTETKLPYNLSDTALLKATDVTGGIPADLVSNLLPDSLKKAYFSKSSAIVYTPLAKFVQTEKENYYVVKASAGQKRGALLLVFNAKEEFTASYPFLLPDANPATAQTTSIDKNFTVTKTVTQRSGAEIVGEGKEVVAYDAASKSFSLIMEEALLDNPAELVNPIDTFAKTNKLAGDYYAGKKNLVAVRDGRYPNQLLVYIHTENEAGDCIGQLKGEFIITSSTTAEYRQSGDPCILGLTFKGTSVSIAEQTGCGNYRGLDCPLTGTFTRKKVQSAKAASGKPKRK